MILPTWAFIAASKSLPALLLLRVGAQHNIQEINDQISGSYAKGNGIWYQILWNNLRKGILATLLSYLS